MHGHEHAAFTRIDTAFRTGDFEGLRAALGSPDGFPDVSGPMTIAPGTSERLTVRLEGIRMSCGLSLMTRLLTVCPEDTIG
jgi:hypothetical protein